MKRRQIAIATIASVVVLVLFYVLLLAPVGSSIAQANKDLDTARATGTSLTLQLHELQADQRNATDIDARLAKFELLLPRSPDLPAFIRQIQDAANASSIDLLSLAPSPPTPLAAGTASDPTLTGKGLFTLNVALSIEGGFFRIKSFFERLESLQRVVQISSISLTPQPGSAAGPGTLQSAVTLILYVLNPNRPVPGATAVPGSSPQASPTPSVGGGGPATPASTPR